MYVENPYLDCGININLISLIRDCG